MWTATSLLAFYGFSISVQIVSDFLWILGSELKFFQIIVKFKKFQRNRTYDVIESIGVECAKFLPLYPRTSGHDCNSVEMCIGKCRLLRNIVRDTNSVL